MFHSTPNVQRDNLVTKVKKTESRFWVFSMVVHGIIITIMLYAPVKEIILPSKEMSSTPEVIKKGEDLEEVIEAIRESTAEKLKARVELLKEGQDRMAVNFDTVNKYFQPFAEKQKAVALKRFKYYAVDTLWRQKELMDLFDKAVRRDDPGDAIEKTAEHMPRILSGLEEIKRGLYLLDIPNAEELVIKQAEAEDIQLKANQFVGWLEGTVNKVNSLKASIPKLEDEIQPLKEKKDTLENEIIELGAERGALVKKVNIEKGLAGKEKDRAKRKELDAQWKKTDGERKKVENEKKKKEGELRSVVSNLKKKVDSLKKYKEELPKTEEHRKSLIGTSKNVQGGAFWKQKMVIDSVYQALGIEEDPTLKPGEEKHDT